MNNIIIPQNIPPQIFGEILLNNLNNSIRFGKTKFNNSDKGKMWKRNSNDKYNTNENLYVPYVRSCVFDAKYIL